MNEQNSSLLEPLSQYLTDRIGLHFSKRQWNDLTRKIEAAMKDFDFTRMDEFVHWLLSTSLTQKDLEILASHLTVSETYFFRENRTFEVLEQNILPHLVHSRRNTDRRIRIWSAGCSTGEEPYSLALLLHKLIPSPGDWNITVLATDINHRVLEKARKGLYSEWSFRGTFPFARERYFEEVQRNKYRICDSIRNMVRFAYLNLSEDIYPALHNGTNAMDLIFCRNVFMYFAPHHIEQTVERFYHSLTDGGWLIVSPVETSHIPLSQFMPVHFDGITFFHKDVSRKTARYGERKAYREPRPPQFEENIIPRGFAGISPSAKKKRFPEKVEKPEPTEYEGAFALYAKHLYGEAEEKLRALTSKGLHDQRPILLLAHVFANQGRLEDAREWCEKALSADKLDAGAHYLLSTILEEQGQTEEAIASLRKALYLNQDFALAHFALGNLALRLGRSAEATKHFENATEILSRSDPEAILSGSEGVTAKRLLEIVRMIRV